MTFPAKREHEDERGLFVVQDSRLRSKILPLFSFDPRSLAERPTGHGTAFRIDPWGGCATAFHVIEDLLTVAGGKAVLRQGIRLAALELEGLGYGRVPPMNSQHHRRGGIPGGTTLGRRPKLDNKQYLRMLMWFPPSPPPSRSSPRIRGRPARRAAIQPREWPPAASSP